MTLDERKTPLVHLTLNVLHFSRQRYAKCRSQQSEEAIRNKVGR